MPRLLLVEDDPTSRAFLASALEALPALVDPAADVAEALCLAAPGRHQAWLLDANLPDGSGSSLLQQLRAGDPATPALCHTADAGPGIRTRLEAHGFAEVISKPITPQALREVVRRHLPVAPSLRVAEQPPRWDDEAATRALNGVRSHVDTLRSLFLEELPGARTRIRTALATGRAADADADLHKLRASCGFVGARQLALRVQDLQQSLEDPAALAAFEAAVDELFEPV